MADKAHNAADVRLEKMEKRLAGIYHRAQKGIEEKATAYFKQFERLDAEKRKLVEAEKMTEAEYKQWRQNKMLYGKRYTDLKKQIAAEIAHVNETAYDYINEQLPELYALGYDAFSDVADGIPGYSFTLVDADTVRHLATTDTSILPYKKLDRAKDIPWNMKRVNAEVLQGILQGESIPKIAARMQKVTGSNAKAAVRTARTAATEAENRGRQDSYERARKDGVMLKRKWIATYDMRTRHAHALLDGQLAEVDEPFESELGPIMFPGDHTAHPSNVYNCRCTLGVKYLGFDGKKTKIKSEDDRDTVADWLKKEREKDPEGFDANLRKTKNANSDKKMLKKLRHEFGSNAPKSLAKLQEMKYNNPKGWKQYRAYLRSIRSGELTSLADFDLYKSIGKEIDENIVGTYTSDGIMITGKSDHFVARVIGSIEQRRNGVPIQDVINALNNPSEIRVYESSKKYTIEEKCSVTVNPKTGILIQTNPVHRKEPH